MKICLVKAKLFHANRHTDRHEAPISHLSQLCEST